MSREFAKVCTFGCWSDCCTAQGCAKLWTGTSPSRQQMRGGCHALPLQVTSSTFAANISCDGKHLVEGHSKCPQHYTTNTH